MTAPADIAPCNPSDFTGADVGHAYRVTPTICTTAAIKAYCDQTRRLFAPVAKGFDDALHTEWLVRSYLALKFVLGATVLASSAAHAEDENLQVALPYLNYYALLNCCRAFVLTLPDHQWRGLTSIEMTHQNTLNSTANALRRIDPKAERRWGDVLRKAHDHRNLFSYRFPATGPTLVGSSLLAAEDAISLARFLAEMAQINSECLTAAVAKHSPAPRRLIETTDTWHTLSYETSDESLIDDDDYHRIGRFFAKLDGPVPLSILATEGLVEDFFGAWANREERSGVYDPDRHVALLLDLY